MIFSSEHSLLRRQSIARSIESRFPIYLSFIEIKQIRDQVQHTWTKQPTLQPVCWSIVSEAEGAVEAVLNRPFTPLLPWVPRLRTHKTQTQTEKPCVSRLKSGLWTDLRGCHTGLLRLKCSLGLHVRRRALPVVQQDLPLSFRMIL